MRKQSPAFGAIQPTPDGIIIAVRVIPRSGRCGLAGMRGGALLVRLNAPPVEGAANAELIEIIAAALGVRKHDVAIVAGARSRQKRVRVSGIDPSMAVSRLAERLG